MATNFVKRRSQWTSSEKNSAFSVNIRKRALGATLDANGNLSIYRPASCGGLGLHIEQEGTAACLQLTGGGIQPAYETITTTDANITGKALTTYGVSDIKTTGLYTVAATLADLDATAVGRTKTVTHSAHGGDVEIEPDSLSGGTKVTLSAAGQSVVFIWDGVGWGAVLGSGAVQS